MKQANYQEVINHAIKLRNAYDSTATYVEGRGLENDPYGINLLRQSKEDYERAMRDVASVVTISSEEFVAEFERYAKDDPRYEGYVIRILNINGTKLYLYMPEDLRISSGNELINHEKVLVLAANSKKNLLDPVIEIGEGAYLPCLSVLSKEAKELYYDRLSSHNKKYLEMQDFMTAAEAHAVKEAKKIKVSKK